MGCGNWPCEECAHKAVDIEELEEKLNKCKYVLWAASFYDNVGPTDYKEQATKVYQEVFGEEQE